MKMRKVILQLFLCHAVSAVTHSLKYFCTASSGVRNLPEFVTIGSVDDVPMLHYDSNTMKAQPIQDWMNKVTADDPQYWEEQTEVCKRHQEILKFSTEVLKQRFSQTGGVDIVQWLYGCEWNDETDKFKGFSQYRYGGEDFIVFDMQTERWIAAKPQAFITKQRWDHDPVWVPQIKQYLTKQCANWLKNYLNYGRNSLQRTELPSVSLLQKSPSSPVSCHATGFYPNNTKMFWRKDGVELHEDVKRGEILHNHDGSFQMSVDLIISSVSPQDWRKYECVFHLSGVKDDIVTRLDKEVVRTNEGKTGIKYDENLSGTMIIAAVVVLALFLIAVIGYHIYKSKESKKKATDSVHSSTPSIKVSEVSSNKDSTESVHSNTPLNKGYDFDKDFDKNIRQKLLNQDKNNLRQKMHI